jgi:hypothetical protein
VRSNPQRVITTCEFLLIHQSSQFEKKRKLLLLVYSFIICSLVLMTTRPPPSRQPADKYRRTSLHGGTSLKQCSRVDCGCLASQRYKHCPCRGATYCSTRCQLADWHRHRVDCIYAREHMTSCTHCGSCTVALLSCPCRVASYCSPECQSANWPHHGTHCTARARNKKPAQRMDPSGP